MIKKIRSIYEYKDMIYSLVRRELRGKYKGSMLGFLWTYINPLCQIIVYSIVFSVIFDTGVEKFYLYLVIGMMPWIFFSTSVQGGSACIRNQSDMVKKIYFPREILPISFVTSMFINMLFSFIIVFAAVLISGIGFNLYAILYLPLIMVIEYIFTLGLVLIISSCTVYLRDLEQIVGVIMMAWIYLTPIMYSLNSVPEELKIVILYNPMTPIIESFHDILYYKQIPSGFNLLYSSSISLIVFLIGFIIFSYMDKGFAEEM